MIECSTTWRPVAPLISAVPDLMTSVPPWRSASQRDSAERTCAKRHSTVRSGSSVQVRDRVESRGSGAENTPVTDGTFMNFRGPEGEKEWLSGP